MRGFVRASLGQGPAFVVWTTSQNGGFEGVPVCLALLCEVETGCVLLLPAFELSRIFIDNVPPGRGMAC